MPSSDRVRWGILGPGRIASRLMQDAGRGSNFSVVAVGSRSLDRAGEFASRFGIARAYGSYEQGLVNAVKAVAEGA